MKAARVGRQMMPRGDSALVGATALALVVLGCDDDVGQHDTFVVRDSVGIEIVESLAPVWTAEIEWRVVAEPEVEIGLIEGPPEYLFSNVEGALLLADGGVAVADRGSSQVRYFSRDGRFQGFVGGPGEGPGELEWIRDIGRCGADSLFVFEIDFLNVVFSPTGSYVREARPFDARTQDRRPYALRCATNGHYVAIGWEPRVGEPGIIRSQGPPLGFYRAEAPAWILAPAHAVSPEGVDVVERIEPAGLVVIAELGVLLSSERIGTERGSRPHPFGRATRLAVNPDAVYVATGETFEIKRFSLAGRLERLIRWPHHDLTIHEDDIEAYRAEQLATVDEFQRPAMERSLRDMPMPPAFPAFVRLESDPTGNIWVEPFQRPGESDQEWTVLSPDGVLLGTVRVPSDLVVTDIGGDVIVGVARDELGVERIRIHPLRKSQTAESEASS